MTNDIPKPEWVKLIPADSIPVFCFPNGTLDVEFERAAESLTKFFGKGRVLVIRGDVEISAIAKRPYTEVAQQELGHLPADWRERRRTR